eukprot:351514-Pleurochrysis_carterae.AAC.1
MSNARERTVRALPQPWHVLLSLDDHARSRVLQLDALGFRQVIDPVPHCRSVERKGQAARAHVVQTEA